MKQKIFLIETKIIFLKQTNIFTTAFCIGKHTPGSTGSLVELHDLLPLLEEPEEGGDAANVEDVGADTHDVVQDAGQLSEQHPDNHSNIVDTL